MDLVSSAKINSVSRSFSYRIPNFLDQAEILRATKHGRHITSQGYKFEAFGHTFEGSREGSLEFCHELQPGYQEHYFDDGTDCLTTCGIHNVKCVMSATLEAEEFCSECFPQCTSFGTLFGQDPHRTVSIVPCDPLKNAVPDKLKETASLCLKSTVTIFEGVSNSDWLEVEANQPSLKVRTSPEPAPILKFLEDRKKSDVIIECGGQEFPTHALVLGCMSSVFSAMMETNMEEAASGRIKVEDVRPETIGRMLKFIYSGKLIGENVSDYVLIELLHCADKYEIAELKETVARCMLGRLSHSNAIKFATALELYRGGDAVVYNLINYCRRNLMELPKGPELEDFVTKNAKRLFSSTAV